jgi:hypothetical protein
VGRRRSIFSAPRRRRRSSSSDAAVALIVVGAVAVAVLGVYLLIGAAVALIGWLATVVARRSTEMAPPPQLTAVPAEPSTASAPQTTYTEVLPVRADVFDDPERTRAAAIQVFSAWASRLPRAPADASGLVRSLRVHRRLIGRLVSRLDGRRYVWRSAPYAGRDRATGRRLDPATLDPYQPPADLRARSRCLSLCDACGGDGRMSCAACGGHGKVTCAGCGGAGKLPGVTANGARRLLNCKACKGKAALMCTACTRGERDCVACARSGRVEHWLEVEGGPRDGDINVEPDGDVTRAFTWGRDGVPASTGTIACDARVVCEVARDGVLTLDDLPADVPAGWRAAHWASIQGNITAHERVVGQHFMLLEVPSVEVVYGLARPDEQQTIELEGLRLLAPPPSADELLAGRARSLAWMGGLLALVPVVTLAVYLARGSYFIGPLLAALVACAAVGSALVYAVVSAATLGRRSARKWLSAAVAPIALATGLAVAAEPRLGRASDLLSTGDLPRARAELTALGGASDPERRTLWDRLHLRTAQGETDIERAKAEVAQISTGSRDHAEAVAHLDKLILSSARAALEAGQTGRVLRASTSSALLCVRRPKSRRS